MKTAHIKLRERTLANDIKYRGPLSYRYIRIIAWACIALSTLGTVFSYAFKAFPNAFGFNITSTILSSLSDFSAPLFLLANFSIILNSRSKFKRLLIMYSGLVVLMYVAGLLFMSHYFFGIIRAFGDFNYLETSRTFAVTFVKDGKSSSYLFNIFIDLILCALVFFFLHYRPKKFFQGKRIYIFRSFIVLPILYEAASTVIKYLVVEQGLRISFYTFLLLTSKPPFMLLAFIFIAVIMKIKDNAFIKKYSMETFHEHTKTNAYSLRVSLFISASFIFATILDVLTTFIYVWIYVLSHGGMDPRDAITAGIQSGLTIGLGKSTALILVIPIILLFSYTRTHEKNKKVDLFIPISGIAFTGAILLVGMTEVVINWLPHFIDSLSGGGSEQQTVPILGVIKNSFGWLISFL